MKLANATKTLAYKFTDFCNSTELYAFSPEEQQMIRDRTAEEVYALAVSLYSMCMTDELADAIENKAYPALIEALPSIARQFVPLSLDKLKDSDRDRFWKFCQVYTQLMETNDQD